MEIAVKRHRQITHEKASAVGKLDAILIEMDQPVCLKAFECFSGILEVLLKIKSFLPGVIFLSNLRGKNDKPKGDDH